MSEAKFVLSQEDAYNKFLQLRALSKTEVAEQLLTETGLSIKKVKSMSEDEVICFERAQDVVRKRLIRLIERVQKKNKAFFDGSETFFDLSDFPTLVKEEDSQCLSQCSNSSNKSWLELEEPSFDRSEFRKRKAFEEVGTKTKKRRTDEIFQLLQQEADRQEISVAKLLSYLGYRASYQKSISDEKPPSSTVPMDLCLYIREQCEIGKKNWTDLRLLLKPYVTLVTYDQLSFSANQILPSLSSFHHGLKADLSEVVVKTLERLPTHIGDKIESLGDGQASIVAHFICGADVSGVNFIKIEHVIF